MEELRVATNVALIVLLAPTGLWAQATQSPPSASVGGAVTVQGSIGKCSVVLNNVKIERDFRIDCDNKVRDDLNPLVDRVQRLSTSVDEALLVVRKLLESNKGETEARLQPLMEAMSIQLQETRKGQFPFDADGLPVDFALKYKLGVGALTTYGNRLERATEASMAVDSRRKWPVSYPFSQITWLTPTDFFYPQAQDGAAREVLDTASIEMNCYTAGQRTDPATRQRINQPQKIEDSVSIPDQPRFAQVFEPRLESCSTGLVVGDALTERTAWFRGVRVGPADGKVTRAGDLVSILDLLGAVCHVIVRSRTLLATADVKQSVQTATLHSLRLSFPRGQGYSMNQNNKKLVEAGLGYVLYTWEMPRGVSDIRSSPVVNDFAPLPACKQ